MCSMRIPSAYVIEITHLDEIFSNKISEKTKISKFLENNKLFDLLFSRKNTHLVNFRGFVRG